MVVVTGASAGVGRAIARAFGGEARLRRGRIAAALGVAALGAAGWRALRA